jgi:hypothetical protein
MTTMTYAMICSSLLGQAGPAQTAAERYLQSACDFLDGKYRGEPTVHITSAKKPSGLPTSLRESAVPAEYRMERDWQKGERCGPVALFFLLRAEKNKVSIDDVMKSLVVTDKGTSMAQLREAAAKFGLDTDVVRFTPDEFADLPVPFIVHWKGPGEESGRDDHFDVVLRTDPDYGGMIVDTTNCAVTSLGSMRAIGARASGYALVVRRRAPATAGLLWLLGGMLGLNLGLVTYRITSKRRASFQRAALAGALGDHT